MARLKGIGPGPAPLSVEEAGERAAALVAPVAGTQTLPLSQADGRVLAEDILAGLPLPPFANSAVDGYALRFDDLAMGAETRLPVLGRVAAGEAAGALAAPGVLRIFTGAPMPPGADTVVMQEDVRRDGDLVVLPPGLRRGDNLRPAGEDVAPGERVLAAGHRLRPQDLGLLAAIGHDQVILRRRPRVALFSTGDELTEPGRALQPAGIYDANRALLRALLTRAGAEPVDLGILRDDRDSLAVRLAEAARDCDLVITSGGVSVGEEDHVKAALSTLGTLDFWRVAIKPGKPVAVGMVTGTPFLGLPGNPVAVFVTFAFVARPMLARLAGTACPPLERLPVRLGFSHHGKLGRREFLRVLLAPGGDGIPLARKHPGEGAGSLVSLVQSDGLVELAEDLPPAEEGSIRPFLPYAALLN